MRKIYFKGTREEAKQLAYRLAGMLSGREPDTLGIAKGFLLSMGVQAMSDIRDAFITKSRGGTDEMGVSWPPLSKEYLAYGRRFGKGEQKQLAEAAGLDRRKNRHMGLLTAAQAKRWREVYGTRLARFLLSLPPGQAKARAAQVAWAVVKREGAKTKLEVYGNRKVEMLHDTSVLFNSIGPGQLSGQGPDATYSKPSGPGGDQQVLEVNAGSVIVGTNVAYAGAHNKPVKSKVPRRQIFPDDGQVPEVWWDRWLKVGLDALVKGAEKLYREFR